MRELSTRHMLSAEQFGFRAQHSMELQILRLVESATSMLKRIQKKKLWHATLIFKIDTFGILKPVIQLIDSYVGEITLQVKL